MRAKVAKHAQGRRRVPAVGSGAEQWYGGSGGGGVCCTGAGRANAERQWLGFYCVDVAWLGLVKCAQRLRSTRRGVGGFQLSGVELNNVMAVAGGVIQFVLVVSLVFFAFCVRSSRHGLTP